MYLSVSENEIVNYVVGYAITTVMQKWGWQAPTLKKVRGLSPLVLMPMLRTPIV